MFAEFKRQITSQSAGPGFSKRRLRLGFDREQTASICRVAGGEAAPAGSGAKEALTGQ
jgi:hypothetical protein